MRQGLCLMVFGLVLGTALPPGRSDGPPAPQRPPAGKSPSAVQGWLEKAESGYYVQLPALAEGLKQPSASEVLQVTPNGPLLIPATPVWSELTPPAAERIKLPIRLADHYGRVPQTTRAKTSETKTAEWNAPAEGEIRGAGQSIRLSFDNSAGFGISVGSADAPCPMSKSCCQDLLPVWMQPLLSCLNGPCDATCSQGGCPLACAVQTAVAAKACNCSSTCQCGDACCCKEGVKCSITCTCKACDCNVNCKCGTGCKCTSTSRCSARCLCSGRAIATDFAQSECSDKVCNLTCCNGNKCSDSQCAVACRCSAGGCDSGKCAQGTCCQPNSGLPQVGKYCHAETKAGNYFGRLESFTASWIVLCDPHNDSRQFIPTASLQCLTEISDSPESLPEGEESGDTSHEVVATPFPNRATCVPLALPLDAQQSISAASAACFLEDEAPAVTIPRGMRLYSTDVANSSVVQIAPGDCVDLLLLALPHPGPEAPPCVSRIFAENVKVAALSPSNCMEATTVSLLVSKDQCELIALANAVGVISICKRSAEDSTESSKPAGDERQAATIQKLLGLSDQPGPGNCPVPVFGVSPWGPMVRPPVAAWGPGPENFAPSPYAPIPADGYAPAGPSGYAPNCPLPSGGPHRRPFGGPQYSDPIEASVPPSLYGPPSAVPAATWPSPTFAAPAQPSTAAVPPTPFPETRPYPTDLHRNPAPYEEPESKLNTLPNLKPESKPKASIEPSTMPTHIKATPPTAPKSAEISSPPSSRLPFACGSTTEEIQLPITFSAAWKELTNRRKQATLERVGTAAEKPGNSNPSLSGLSGGKIAMPVRMEQLASYTAPAQVPAPPASQPLYRLDCQFEVEQADGQRVKLSAPQIVTPAESSLALGESQFKFRVEPAHDGKLQLTVCDPRGFCHVTPLRDGESISLPWANDSRPESGTIRVGVARANAALTALLSAANQAEAAAKICLAAHEEVEAAESTDDAYYVLVYPIADLIEQTQVAPPLLAKGEHGAASLTDSSQVAARVDDLLEKIHAAAPENWDGQGGSAHVEYYPAKRALVIRQTSANHHRIGGLLQVLRDADQLARGERAGANAATVSKSYRVQ